MKKERLTVDGFREIMNLLREDRKFRQDFLSDDPKQAVDCLKSKLPKEDLIVISNLEWEKRCEVVHPIDEKLVLASSSGY